MAFNQASEGTVVVVSPALAAGGLGSIWVGCLPCPSSSARPVGEPVGRLLERARHLGRKLGPLLLQLPPTLQADLPLLADVLAVS